MNSDLFWIIDVALALGAVLLIPLIGFFAFRARYQVPQADKAIVIV